MLDNQMVMDMRLANDDALSTTFFALADPTRRAILVQLSRGAATVKEISAPFPISGWTTSSQVPGNTVLRTTTVTFAGPAGNE